MMDDKRQSVSAERKPLTPEQETRRKRGLRSANGIGNWFGYKLFRGTVVLLSRIMMQGEIKYLSRLPQPHAHYYPRVYRRFSKHPVSDSAFVVAPNHSHMLDIALTGFIRRPMAWPSKPAFVKRWVLKQINQRVGCVPFMRDVDWLDHPEYAEISYTKEELKDIMHEALMLGQPVVLYPQGTRRDDANFEDSQLGAMYAAIRADVPLVPLAIYGLTKTDQHFKTRWLKRKRAIAIVMEPIHPRDYPDYLSDRERARIMLGTWQDAITRGRALARDLLLSLDYSS